MTYVNGKLMCDGAKLGGGRCEAPVTRIDTKGFVYCDAHGGHRRSFYSRQSRKLRPHELNKLERGEPLKEY